MTKNTQYRHVFDNYEAAERCAEANQKDDTVWTYKAMKVECPHEKGCSRHVGGVVQVNDSDGTFLGWL